MSDLIRREDAIKILSERAEILRGEYGDLGGACSGALKIIKAIPSAEPERNKGKWIWTDGVRCSRCYYKLQTTGIPRYCPNCGCYNEGENEKA